MGLRGFHAVFNVAGDPVAEIVRGYRAQLEALANVERAEREPLRELVGSAFTRGHFARAV
jgi:hypothetical protein